MIALRPLCPQDACAFQKFVRELSPESRLHRFLFPVRELAPRLLAALTRHEQPRHVALGAFEGATMIGEGRYVALGGGGRAEFAIAVADAWQRRGIGARLIETLSQAARSAGLGTLQGEILRTNQAMLEFARRAGFRLSICPGDATLAIAERDLQNA